MRHDFVGRITAVDSESAAAESPGDTGGQPGWSLVTGYGGFEGGSITAALLSLVDRSVKGLRLCKNIETRRQRGLRRTTS